MEFHRRSSDQEGNPMPTFRPSWRQLLRGNVLNTLVCVAVLTGCGGGGTGSAAPVSSTPTSGTGSTGSIETISGTPPTQVQEGQTYSFTPTVSGPDGAAPAFSIQNKPAWATFSESSGQLTGTPSGAQVATYSNIVISVVNGSAHAALAPFSITVTAAQQTAQGSATVSWAAPTANTDGSQISGLNGYQIDYGNDPTSLTQTVTISDPAVTSYTIQGLSAGTWYFAVSDSTTGGGASDPSTPVSKTIH
jgi:hypothetical protein